MKKIVYLIANSIRKSMVDPVLLNFMWYRKWRGGKWYRVQLLESELGIEGPIVFWTQEAINEEDIQILKIENWPNRKPT